MLPFASELKKILPSGDPYNRRWLFHADGLVVGGEHELVARPTGDNYSGAAHDGGLEDRTILGCPLPYPFTAFVLPLGLDKAKCLTKVR